MSERKTGATAAQIEAAARKLYEAIYENTGSPTWGEVAETSRGPWIEHAARQAERLVPPGYAIVSRDDLRAVLGYVPEEAFDVDDPAVDMAAVGMREVLGE